MSTGTLTIEELVTNKSDYVKVKDVGGKTWNCNEKKLLRTASDGQPVFTPGRRLTVEYRESQPEGQKFPSRWINDARPATDDEPDTFKPREGGGYGGGQRSSGEDNKSKGDYRKPAEIKRSSAIGIAASLYQGKDWQIEGIIETAKVLCAYIDGAFDTNVDPLAEEAKAVFDAVEVDDDDGIPF